MNVERIHWRDSGYNISEGWKPVVEALGNFKFDNMIVESAGFVVYEDDDVLALTPSWSQATEAAYGLQLIAKSNILSREVALYAATE